LEISGRCIEKSKEGKEEASGETGGVGRKIIEAGQRTIGLEKSARIGKVP
jgi:hypothetical protein